MVQMHTCNGGQKSYNIIEDASTVRFYSNFNYIIDIV